MATSKTDRFDPFFVRRVARYQAQGLSPTAALAKERKAGRGMRRQRWFGLWKQVQEFPPPLDAPEVIDWEVKEPKGWITWVQIVVEDMDNPGSFDRIPWAIRTRKKPSQGWAVRLAVDSYLRAAAKRKVTSVPGSMRVVRAWVSSYRREVPETAETKRRRYRR